MKAHGIFVLVEGLTAPPKHDISFLGFEGLPRSNETGHPVLPDVLARGRIPRENPACTRIENRSCPLRSIVVFSLKSNRILRVPKCE